MPHKNYQIAWIAFLDLHYGLYHCQIKLWTLIFWFLWRMNIWKM